MKTDELNLKKFILPALLMGITLPAAATWPAGYYDSLEGKCGAELMRAVKAVVADHKEINYGNDTWAAFKHTDVRKVNGVDCWWDMYSNNDVRVSSGHPGMNIEHSVANSWWGKTKSIPAYKDIVHLNPSDSEANSRKGNYPLSKVGSVSWTNGVTTVGKPVSGQGGGASMVYEPIDEYKGDFARVFMYMFTVYDDISWKSNTSWMYNTSSSTMFKDWAKTLLLDWHAADPVSDKERSRNDGVYSQQKNRNPYIDLPDLALHIWGSKSNVPFSLTGSPVNPGEDPEDPKDPEDATSYEWLGENDSNMGDWTIEDVQLPEGGSYVWNWKTYDGKHYLNGSAFISGTAKASKAYAWSPVVSLENATAATFNFEHAAKFQTTLRDLCSVVVRDAESGDITEVAIPSWPASGKWTFSGSGDIDLVQFAGKKVNIGFKYESNTSGADTWEIRNAHLGVTRDTSAIDMIPDYEEDDSFLVEVWGRDIVAPEGARIFDLNGREYDGRNVQPGLYLVVKPSFSRTVKVLVK